MTLLIKTKHSRITLIGFAILLGLLPLKGQNIENESLNSLEKKNSDSHLLQSQKWILQKAWEIQGDNRIDQSEKYILMCQEDDILQFSADHTYSIYQSELKCKGIETEIMGSGTWEWIKESSFEDRYQEGRRIIKNIIFLDENYLELIYEGPAGIQIQLRYISEASLLGEAEDKLSSENIEQIRTKSLIDNLEFLWKNILLESGRYLLFNDDAEISKSNEASKYLKRLVLKSFIDNYSTPERRGSNDVPQKLSLDNSIQGHTDFIIGGSLEDILMEKKKNGPIITIIYKINIWNGKTGVLIISETISTKHNSALKNSLINTGLNALQVATVLGGAISNDVSAGETRELVNDLEGMHVRPQYKSQNGDTILIDYDKPVWDASLKAIRNSKDEAQKIVKEHLPLDFSIHSITQYHKNKPFATRVKLNAGSLANLKSGEILEVVDTKAQALESSIAKLQVFSIDGPHHSTCKITQGNKEITEVIKKDPNHLIVLTTGKIGINISRLGKK